uniref:Uncharacterized 13.1 kDa protein n=1 Tax=Leptolyngbya boryana TaxID=1184 RepID=YPS2_LEPBY|nr:RecName: Full=Uncharacterized 13.1 kDa protein; AltName: Full=ORF2 [Leptolyngbya boryana]
MKRRLIYSNGLHGLPTEIIACTEVQEKRYERTGEVAFALASLSWSDGIVEELGAIVLDSWKKCGVNAAKLPSGMLLSQNERVTSRVTNSRTESESNGNGNATGNTSSNANSNGNANGIYIRK